MALARRRRAAAQTTFKLCSLLLEYPGEELLALRADVLGVVATLPASPAATALGRFCSWWEATAPLAAAQHYVETIDLHKRSGLYMTFYAEGDRRERGMALLRLRRLYRAAGLPQEGGELPDYLPVMLEFAAAAPAGRGELVLREHRAALELLRLSLREHSSPYAYLLDAVCLTLGEASAADRARAARLAAGGPPSELVGLEPFAPPEVMPPVEARR
jgi:nitrate reductase molybdenum cofactor assembly chaperone NarJ/NarW